MPVQPDQTIDPQTGLPPNVTAPNLAPPPAPAQQPGGTRMDYLVSQGLVDPGRETEFYRLNAQRGQIEQQAAGNINARMGMADRAITAPVAMPAQPKLQDVPKPPQYQYRDAMQTFQSPAVLLATLGSLFTRRPAVNALTAGAAAITGFMEGDKEKVEREEKNWKNAVEATIQQNQKEINEFNAAATGTRLNIADRDARLSAIFSANKDEMGLAALRTGSQERLQQFQEMKIKAQDALVNSIEKYNAQFGRGLLPDETLNFMADQVLSGDKSPYSNIGRGAQGAENIERLRTKVMEKAQERGLSGGDLGMINAEFEGLKSGQRNLGTRLANLTLIENEIDRAVPTAMAASDAIPRGRWVPLNQLIQKGQVTTSNPQLKAFATANLQLAELWARSMNPTGVMRNEDRNLALGTLSIADGPEAWKAAVNMIVTGIRRNKEAAKATREELLGRGDIDQSPPSSPGGGGASTSSDGWTTVAPNVRIRERK